MHLINQATARELLCVSFLSCLTILPGCESSKTQVPFAPLSGKVTYQGKALPQGQILLVHSSGSMGASEIRPDGHYEMQAPVGENRVMVDARDQKNLSQISPKQGRPLQQAKSVIPARYNDYVSSGLKLKIVEGSNQHDFNLKD
jgi:hypothetical protein